MQTANGFTTGLLPEAAVPSRGLEQHPDAVEAPLGGRVVQRVRRREHGGRVRIVVVVVAVPADPLRGIAPFPANVVVIVQVVIDGRRQAGKQTLKPLSQSGGAAH